MGTTGWGGWTLSFSFSRSARVSHTTYGPVPRTGPVNVDTRSSRTMTSVGFRSLKTRSRPSESTTCSPRVVYCPERGGRHIAIPSSPDTFAARCRPSEAASGSCARCTFLSWSPSRGPEN